MAGVYYTYYDITDPNMLREVRSKRYPSKAKKAIRRKNAKREAR